VLRAATPRSIDRLVAAVHLTDREFDTALIQLGILPPLDLSEIRSWLSVDGVTVIAGQNPDGHRVLAVVQDGRTLAWIHHDGRVLTSGQHELLSA
jgi:hypothetical protein